MRSVSILSVAAVLMAATSSHAMSDAQVGEFIKQELVKKMSVTATPIKEPSVVSCFSAVFYRVEITRDVGGGTSTERAVYMRTAKGIEEASKPCTNQAMPMLPKIINPKFLLKDDATANTMLSALKAIYVRKSSFRPKVEPMVKRNGNTWNFILDEFMGKKYSGFVVTTDANGRITKVDYSLGIAK